MTTEIDAIVVGAGFAGMYMLHKLRAAGLSVRVIEAGDGVGGTWHWNRYPGARVDVQSLEYGYSFDAALEHEWRWTERYAGQPELLRYLNHVADRFDLRRDISLNMRVTAAHFDEAASRWSIATDQGDHYAARYCIMATGCLSTPKELDFEGVESFAGAIYKTSDWPRDGVDFTGKRVGVIGTGSSAIQSIPIIAAQAAQLTVFQRTPNYSVPAHNGALSAKRAENWLANREANRNQARSEGFAFLNEPTEQLAVETPAEERAVEMERRWKIGGFSIGGAYADQGIDPAANAFVAEFVAQKIREIVKDAATADLLTPKTYPFGTKRLCVDSDYYATYNRSNVQLINLQATPIETLTPEGIKTSEADFGLDAIVFATGFDAMTGTLAKIDIRGRGGETLHDKWAEGPRTYLGLMVAGFPNLFTITGPGSPSVLTNMVMAIEQHVEWISDCIAYVKSRQQGLIEATAEAEAMWVAHVNEVANMMLYPQANSWYMGANVLGKPRVFMPYVGGFPVYVEACNDVVAKGYDGFVISDAQRC